MMRLPTRPAPNGPMSGATRQSTAPRGSFTGGANAGAPKQGTGNVQGVRARIAGMLARGTPYDAGGGQRPFNAFLNGRAGPGEGQTRRDWLAANPNMQRQWQAYRQNNIGAINEFRGAHGRGPMANGGGGGIGGQDANWWRQAGYTPQFVSQLPGLLQQAGDYNYGGMDPATVDWNDPRAIRRAAAFLPYDVSQYRSNGHGRDGGDVWNGWQPGDLYGRGMPISAPPQMHPNYIGGGG